MKKIVVAAVITGVVFVLLVWALIVGIGFLWKQLPGLTDGGVRIALYREWEQGDFELTTPFDSLKELKGLAENATFTNCFFSSMHASNYFAIRGKMPEDRDKLLGQLNALLSKKDSRLLRSEFMRGL